MTEKKHCHDVSNILDLYIHDELDNYGKEKIEEHIAVCGECRLLFEGESAIIKAIKRFGNDTPDIASAVMMRIIENKLTVNKPKKKFNFAPSIIPAAVAVIAVTLFSRTNIMKMVEKNFDSAENADEVYTSPLYVDGAELKSSLGSDSEESDEAEAVIPYAIADQAMGKNENSGDAVLFDGESGVEISETEVLPEPRSILLATEENYGAEVEIDKEIQAMTDEYNEEIFDTVIGQLNATDRNKKDAINTLIVLNGENEALLAELLQDIEYEEINGIIMADMSAFGKFRQNATENEFNDFKIYQEDTDSTVLAFTFSVEE